MVPIASESTPVYVIVIQVAAPIAAAFAAFFSYLGVSARNKQTKASILLGCLNSYVEIRKNRTKAIQQKTLEQSKDYYRSVFDLHWTEFHLWLAGNIPDNVMRAWLDARHRNYEIDKLRIQDDTGNYLEICYESEWNELVKGKYFAPSDVFVEFMTLTHQGQFEVAMDKKRWRKKT